MTATPLYQNRVCVLFDFDLTLAPDSFSALLRRCGVDYPGAWREAHVQTRCPSEAGWPASDGHLVQTPVEAGWEQILARVQSLVRLSRSGAGLNVTEELVREAGRSIEPFEGVPEMFGELRESAAAALPGLEVEFYLLTFGFSDLHRAVSFAGEFAGIWGAEFHFDESGEIAFPKRIVTHPEKVRYVLQLSKGIGTDGPADVYRDVPDERMHVRLDQVVHVGDGGSDMPMFSLLHDRGGTALAVYKAERAQDWSGQSEMRAGRRVQKLAPADFKPGSELMRSLRLAVEIAAKKVALRRLGAGG